MHSARLLTTLAGSSLATVLVASGLGLTAAPASAADAFVSISTSPLVRYSEDCVKHPVRFSALGNGPDVGNWTITLRLWKGNASTPTAQTVFEHQGGTTATDGTINLTVCGDKATPGAYSLEYQFAHGPGQTRLIANSTAFTVRAPKTRTGLATTSLGGGKHRAKIKVTRETPSGYKATQGARVRLQHKTASGWALVKGTRTRTKADGTVLVTFTSPKPRKAVTVRAVTAAAPFRAGSTSPTRTIGG
ncbi:MAG: hypothetical protein ACI379_17190 [Nocardioides sp.]|uniref:hypothetical protein n=1 Tax=Nocardioides sp. TaxID=35761 RepID=UPI003EFDACDF